MQGKKELHPKMMYQISLDDLVPENNYYRMINRELDLKYLYKATEKHYGFEEAGKHRPRSLPQDLPGRIFEQYKLRP